MSNATQVHFIGSKMQASPDATVREWGRQLRGMAAEIGQDGTLAAQVRALMADGGVTAVEDTFIAFDHQEHYERTIKELRAEIAALRRSGFKVADHLTIPAPPFPEGVANLGMERALRERRT